jgi:hypothetical protein
MIFLPTAWNKNAFALVQKMFRRTVLFGLGGFATMSLSAHEMVRTNWISEFFTESTLSFVSLSSSVGGPNGELSLGARLAFTNGERWCSVVSIDAKGNAQWEHREKDAVINFLASNDAGDVFATGLSSDSSNFVALKFSPAGHLDWMKPGGANNDGLAASTYVVPDEQGGAWMRFNRCITRFTAVGNVISNISFSDTPIEVAFTRFGRAFVVLNDPGTPLLRAYGAVGELLWETSLNPGGYHAAYPAPDGTVYVSRDESQCGPGSFCSEMISARKYSSEGVPEPSVHQLGSYGIPAGSLSRARFTAFADESGSLLFMVCGPSPSTGYQFTRITPDGKLLVGNTVAGTDPNGPHLPTLSTATGNATFGWGILDETLKDFQMYLGLIRYETNGEIRWIKRFEATQTSSFTFLRGDGSFISAGPIMPHGLRITSYTEASSIRVTSMSDAASFRFDVQGAASNLVLETSLDLRTWMPRYTNSATAFSFTNDISEKEQFFRVVP